MPCQSVDEMSPGTVNMSCQSVNEKSPGRVSMSCQSVNETSPGTVSMSCQSVDETSPGTVSMPCQCGRDESRDSEHSKTCLCVDSEVSSWTVGRASRVCVWTVR